MQIAGLIYGIIIIKCITVKAYLKMLNGQILHSKHMFVKLAVLVQYFSIQNCVSHL